jgi:hypothetical protein
MAGFSSFNANASLEEILSAVGVQSSRLDASSSTSSTTNTPLSSLTGDPNYADLIQQATTAFEEKLEKNLNPLKEEIGRLSSELAVVKNMLKELKDNSNDVGVLRVSLLHAP